MAAVYYLSSWLACLVVGGAVTAFVRPSLFKRWFGSLAKRRYLLPLATLSLMGLTFVVGQTEPLSVKQARLNKPTPSITNPIAVQPPKSQTKAVAVSIITEKLTLTHESLTQPAPGLLQGQTKVIQAGVNGEKTLTYKVMYVDGHETKRELINSVVNRPALPQITALGSYVPPRPTPPVQPKPIRPTKPDPVTSPVQPQGPSARCRDGSYSYSAHRQGTCSHHGGVAQWL